MTDRIEKQIDIQAKRARVWTALTDSQQFGEWFKVKMETPFQPGAPSEGQITHPGYEHLRMRIDVQEIRPETYFSYKWHPFAVDPAVDYTHETPTLVEFFLEDRPSGTHLRVVESGFDSLPAERRDEAFRANNGGWAQQMDNIEAYVGEHP